MKILIGCPTCDRYRYCVDLWISRVKEIIEFSKDKEVDYLLVDNSSSDEFFEELKKKGVNVFRIPYLENVKERLVSSRNVLREKALKGEYDYFFSLEQDVIPEKNILDRLLSFEKKIVSAYYGKLLRLVLQDKKTDEIKEAVIELPVVYHQFEEEVIQANAQDVFNRGLIKVGAFGVGCMLIHCDVLDKIKFRFEDGKPAYDDMLFCSDAKKLGCELFLDSDTRVEHLHKVWENV